MLAVISAAALVGVGQQLGFFYRGGREPVTFTVKKGENFAGIARRLSAQGVVDNERAFRWYVNFVAPAKPLRRGEFALTTHMPVPEVIMALTEGKPVEYKFTVPEGGNLFQIGEQLEARGFVSKADFIDAATSPDLLREIPGIQAGRSPPASLEGYLFPDTYMLQYSYSARDIARIMLQHFKDVYRKVEPEIQASPVVRELGLDSHQVVTLASIVEKETGAGFERPLVASTFVNRLRKRMRLQTDPTIIYGIYLAKGSWNGNISRRDLDTPGPYNSYKTDGLPPGPIANPGLSAIRAVLSPASTDYLYFVSKGDGTHVFSKDYASHARRVQEMVTRPPSRDGKSWRNLPAEARPDNRR